jgi:tetratricopeptide (TPR) repeat protein
MKKVKIIILLVFGLNPFSWVQAQSNLDAIKALLKEGKSKKAFELVNKDIDKNGFNIENACIKSEILFHINADQAWENMQLTLQKFPNEPRAYNTRGLFYYQIREMNLSVKDFTKALELNPDDSLKFEILINRSGSYHHADQISLAIADCREALKLRPNNIDGLNNLATTLFEKKEYDEAEKILLQMKEIDPKYMGVYVNLGYQNQQRGLYKKSEKYLLEGLAIEPNNGFILNNLGYSQYKLGKNSEAIKNINKSLKYFPGNSYAYRNLALIYLDQNDKVKACENIRLSLANKFTQMYGDEMKDLKEKICP